MNPENRSGPRAKLHPDRRPGADLERVHLAEADANVLDLDRRRRPLRRACGRPPSIVAVDQECEAEASETCEGRATRQRSMQS